MFLDLLLVANLSGAVVILLTAMSVKRPLDFSIFPSLLLVATMARLSLNVSSTRLVLLDGFAGKVIESFGHFEIGGSVRSEEHTSELQSLMRISYAVFCLKKKTQIRRISIP